jgi:hypothetical protein
MKTLKWSLFVVLVTGVGVLTIMLRTRSPRPVVTEANERNASATYQPSPLVTAPVRKVLSTVPPTPHKTDVPVADIVSESANIMRVRADRVLAKVNDRTILLKDLVSLRPDQQEQAMTVEEYESRLNRAIEMALTFQAAANRRVDLTPEQKKRVDGIGQRHAATAQQYQKQGITWSSVTAGQVEFEQRLTAALLLQQNLVAKEAGVAPASDPTMQARYEQARGEVLNQLRAQGKVSVSIVEL